MAERYAQLQIGVVGGFAGPRVTLRAGAFECPDACAVVAIGGMPGPERRYMKWGAVVPRADFATLLDSLDALGVWTLPLEDPPNGEDIYELDTSLWLSDGQRLWHNGAPPGCIMRRSAVYPDDAEKQRFAAAVERILAFIRERVKNDPDASRTAARLLATCENEGARIFAELLAEGARKDLAEYLAPPEPAVRAETGTGGLRWTLHGHLGRVDACVVSADGTLVASGGEDTSVRVWDARDGTLLWTLAAGPAVRALGFSADNRYLASVSDEFLTLWNLRASFEWEPEGREQLACVTWSDWPGTGYDEAWVQACRVDEAAGHLRIWFALPDDSIIWVDVERDDGCLIDVGERTPGMRRIAFRPDGGAVFGITPSADVTARRVHGRQRRRGADTITLQAHDRSRGPDSPEMVLSAGNTHVVFGRGDTARVMSAAAFSAEPNVLHLEGALVACSVARDRALAATACMGALTGSVLVWDLERREVVRTLTVAEVSDCALSADGSVLVNSAVQPSDHDDGAHGVVQVWDL
jgi:WD40 repeat protein